MSKLMYQSWWKVAGILIMCYVIIAGLSAPLKPGIMRVSPSKINIGQESIITFSCYNSHFKAESLPRVYFKLDSVHLYEASNVQVIDRKTLQATIVLNQAIPSDDRYTLATAIIADKENGYLISPQAITIEQSNGVPSSSEWQAEIINADTGWQFKFPFRGIIYETIRNTFFHVAIWFAMFILLIISLIYSLRFLKNKDLYDDALAASCTHVAILFGILGMVTGSIWAKNAWGAYWTDDPKLNMSAVALMIYIAYAILRSAISGDDQRARVSAAYNVFAFVALIPLVFVIPRLTSSLHPGNGGNPALGGEDLDNTLRLVFYPAIIGLSLLGLWISSLLYRIRRIELSMIDRDM